MHKDVEKIRENLYVRKKKHGYQMVYPLKREDGSINWRNAIIGDPQLLKISIMFLLALGMIWYGTHEMIDHCEASIEILQTEELSCDICEYHMHGGQNPFYEYEFNFTINDTGGE